MKVVHFGVPDSVVDEVIGLGMRRFYPFADWNPPIITHGDGWNCWGEAPGTDSNDRHTIHMVIKTESVRPVITLIRRIMGNHLIPADSRALLVVSDDYDWGDQDLCIYA